MSREHRLRDLLLLHGIVVIWAGTAVLGKLVHLPSSVLVAWRTGIAAVAMLIILGAMRASIWPGWGNAVKFIATGFVISLHWLLFFLAAKVGTVSACLVGLSTWSVWSALLEPIFVRGKRLGVLEMTLAGMALAGAVIIFSGDPLSRLSLLTGVASAFVATIFNFINTRLVKGHNPLLISQWEMAGACLIMAAASPFLAESGARWIPVGMEWLWILTLSLVCTVFAFTTNLKLLKRLSVFTISLVANLEPVYGILMAAAIFVEHKELSLEFWIGGALICLSVLAYPWMVRKLRSRDALKHAAPAAQPLSPGRDGPS